MTYNIRFASLNDADNIMIFMDQHWKSGHILSKSKKLLLRDFQEGRGLNIAIAVTEQQQIVGIFGFIKYSQELLPDIGGSLWLVIPKAQKVQPMLGIALRNFVINQVPHRYFAAPGANLITKPIYQVLKMEFQQMQQWYWLNPSIKFHQIVKFNSSVFELPKPLTLGNKDSLIPLHSSDDVNGFEFINNTYPFKDATYVKKRFFNYPFFEYDLFFLSKNNQNTNLIVCRKATYQGSAIYRVVDFYGTDSHLPEIIYLLSEKVKGLNCEGLDWLCLGMDPIKMKASGLTILDTNVDDVIMPNFFQPFVRKNVPVFTVFDKASLTFRQFKADGDQDRPNEIVKC